MNIQKFSHQFPRSHVEKDSLCILAVVPALHNGQQQLGGIVLEIHTRVSASFSLLLGLATFAFVLTEMMRAIFQQVRFETTWIFS